MRYDHGWQKFWLLSILHHWKMAFLHLKGKLTLLEKTSKWNWLFFKKYQKLFASQISSSCVQHVQPFWVQNWKKNNTIFTVSEIQTMRKLNNPTTTTITGFFLVVFRFNLLEWWHSHKNKETLYPFFFL